MVSKNTKFGIGASLLSEPKISHRQCRPHINNRLTGHMTTMVTSGFTKVSNTFTGTEAVKSLVTAYLTTPMWPNLCTWTSSNNEVTDSILTQFINGQKRNI